MPSTVITSSGLPDAMIGRLRETYWGGMCRSVQLDPLKFTFDVYISERREIVIATEYLCAEGGTAFYFETKIDRLVVSDFQQFNEGAIISALPIHVRKLRQRLMQIGLEAMRTS